MNSGRYSKQTSSHMSHSVSVRERSPRPKLSFVSLIEVIFWWGFLALILIAAFIHDFYASHVWYKFSAVWYLYCAVYLCHALFGGRANIKAVNAAKWPVLFLVFAIFWLLLQIIWPSQLNASSNIVLNLNAVEVSASSIPQWFTPEYGWSIEPKATQILLMSSVLCLSVFILTLLICDSRNRIKQLLAVVLIAGLTHAFSGIFAKYANLILVEPKQIDGHFSAARGWFINRNHYAAFISLSMVAPIAFILKKIMRGHIGSFVELIKRVLLTRHVLFFLSLLFGFFAMTLSQSRAGLLALPASIVLFSILNRNALKRYAGAYRSLLGMMIVLVIMAITFGSDVITRLSNGFLSVGERSTQWSITWQAIKEQWFFGYGGGSYASVFQAIREQAPLRQVVYDQSHNYYLHLWLEQGLVGLLLWVGFIATVLVTLYKSSRFSKSTMIRSLSIASGLVIFAALAQSIVDFNLQIINIRLYFFVIIAMVFCVPSLHKRRRVKRISNST